MKSRNGYALIAALWFLVLVSAVALEAAHSARSHRLLAAGLAEGAQARLAAAAGIEHARARLTALARLVLPGETGESGAIVDPWHAAGQSFPDTVLLDGSVRYAVQITDLNALLNINQADEEQLRHFLLSLRMDARAATRIAQSVLDWRDADDFRRVDGGEASDYIAAGRPVLSRNGPFDDIQDLQHVMGVTPALFAAIRPHITTLGSGRINIATAAAPVLAAVPGMSSEAVALVVRRRTAGRPVRSAQELQRQLSPAGRETLERELPRFLSLAVFDTREVVVASTGWIEGSPVRVRSTAVLARGGSAAVMTWRQSE